MLTSLKYLQINGSSITFLPLVKSGVKWQFPVTRLDIQRWTASGKELARLLSHLPELFHLTISDCDKITRLGVEAEQKQTSASLSMPASSIVEFQDTHGTDQQQEIALEVEEEVVAEEVVAEQQEEEDDGLLLLPANLSVSLQDFVIRDCLEPILTVQNRGTGGGGLQFMHSLKSMEIRNCTKFLSAYKGSDLPFPSSLQDLVLYGRMEGMALSNLTSLHLLKVCASPNYFAGWDPAQTLQALFTSGVFPPPRTLGMRGDLVNPSISPNPQISPIFQFPMFTLNFGDGRGSGGEGIEMLDPIMA
jgi:hypothetical protein